jgi:hypothetical protein
MSPDKRLRAPCPAAGPAARWGDRTPGRAGRRQARAAGGPASAFLPCALPAPSKGPGPARLDPSGGPGWDAGAPVQSRRPALAPCPGTLALPLF